MRPKVSVVITTHKGVDSIKRSVESVLSQNYNNIEVVVVDDNGLGSSAQIDTQTVLKDYILDKRIVYIAHDSNSGGSVARNTGFKNTTGEFIGFLDDDDYYLPDKIVSSIDKLSLLDNTWGAVYSNTLYDSGNLAFILKYKKEGNLLFEVFNHTIFMNPGTAIIRREIVESLNGFDESFERHQDYEFFTRLASSTKIAHINTCGTVYSCAVKRHGNIYKHSLYRKYYLFKMSKELSQLSNFEQKITIAKNVIDIVGPSFRRYLTTVKEWGYKESTLGYIYALFLLYKERIFVYLCRHAYTKK